MQNVHSVKVVSDGSYLLDGGPFFGPVGPQNLLSQNLLSKKYTVLLTVLLTALLTVGNPKSKIKKSSEVVVKGSKGEGFWVLHQFHLYSIQVKFLFTIEI